MSSAVRALHDLNGSHAPLSPLVPAAPPPPPARPATDSNPLLVSLISLAESWPEAVRQELVQLNLVDARVALPTEVVVRAHQQGRVAFTWKTLRSWIKPAPLPVVSAHDSSVLELPLKVVAPPFLARQKETSHLRKKVSVDNEIPNLFFGFPRPESGSATVASAAGAAAASSADTNFYVWDDSSDKVHAQQEGAKRNASPGTKFVAKYATPNEVVSRAAALDGVAGALIALPDGLMVASRLSPDLNGDTLAAFLPQIFGKVTQCTKELRMGELNNVNFTVGNVPWKIFRVNAIFFAAFGRAGEPLPTAQLAALATELDHKPK
jgi:predicted regulator of Ras-like GTPase activity (Roadblock/LC7/MglB family)